jgi:hypothetical protein
METDQTLQQKKVSFATSEHYQGAIELLKQSLTEITTLIGENEFKTVLNAMTVELETALVQRFVVAINNIRTGENLNQPLT